MANFIMWAPTLNPGTEKGYKETAEYACKKYRL